MNTHYWKEHVNKHFMELEKEYNQDCDESKAIPCPDPRCGLSFDSIDALRHHCQDTLCINLLKFSPRGSAISRAIAKEDPKSESLLKGSDDKTQVDFVNETVERVSSLCVERFVPKDELGVKRKRGRPRKHCGVSSTAPPSTVSTNDPSEKRKRGRPRKRYSESSVPPLPSVPQGKLGIKRKRGRPRRRYRASSTVSSSRSTSPQSRAVQYLESEIEPEASDDESQSEFDYEMVELSASTIPQETYSVSRKRKRKGNLWGTSSTASSSPSTATPSTSAGSSQRSLRYSITPRTSITSTPCSKGYWNHKPSKSVAATPQVVIYV